MKYLNYILTILTFCYTIPINAQTDSIRVYKLDEIVITGSRVLDKSSESVIDSNTIGMFTYHQPYDVFTLAPGILRRGKDIIVRGGNRNDIDWQIEGISVRDPQTSGYIISTNMNAIENIKFSPGGLIANTGNARGAIIDVSLINPESNFTNASFSMGTFNTRIMDGMLSRKLGKFKFIFSTSLMTSDAILLDSRVPIDYNPYTRTLNSDEIFPTEINKGVRLNMAYKGIYQTNERTKFSFFINYSFEQADNPPLFHNGKNFSPTDIQKLISSIKIDSADYSSYPFNKLWGGIIDNSGLLIATKIEKLITNKSHLDFQPFVFYTYKHRQDHDGSWFFEQGYGGAYNNTRNNYQYGMKSDYFNEVNKFYNFKIASEYRLTSVNYTGEMIPTIIDSYGNIRRNFYNNAQYTLVETQNPLSPYFGWPNPQSIITPLKEKYSGNYFYLVTILNNSFKIYRNVSLNLGLKNTTTNIGKDVCIYDPFSTVKINFLKYFTISAAYSSTTQITSIYNSYSNPYDPYTYGYEATFDAEGNPNIKPEIAHVYEMGMGFESKIITLGLTYYIRESSDDILMNYAPDIVPASVDPNIAKHYMQYQNLGSGKATGMEVKLIAKLPLNFRISVFGNLFADSRTKTTNTSDYEYTKYNQKNTLNILVLYNHKKIAFQLQTEYGSGLPYRWREMGVDQNGNTVQIKRHNYDKSVRPHIVFNGYLVYTIIPKLSFEMNLINIQGLLSPILNCNANNYVEFRDTDNIQNPIGIPRYAYNSIPRFNLGIKYSM